MNIFKKLHEKAKKEPNKTLVVACAEDEDVLLAVERARKKKIINAILVGNQKKIEQLSLKNKIPLEKYQVINISDIEEAALEAVKLVNNGIGHILMKGFVDTSVILKAVLNPKLGLRIDGNLLSHIGLFYVKNGVKARIVTDAAMNIAPTLDEKIKILENAVKVCRALGTEVPKVAVLCAKEKVSPKMKATIDAAELQSMNERGEIKNCVVLGPVALDIAVSKTAAEHKNISSPVAGEADILLVPEIESGNILYKALTYFCESESAGIIVGAKAPIVLTSRSDSDKTKFNSILLATVL
ncbi:MAG: bifunctional enoyl-CoA hydratase/phosphate acetyltransferase [Fusobacteriaceae bacterium]